MPKERIIPIQIEKSQDEEPENISDTEQIISKPMKQLTIKVKKLQPDVQVKTNTTEEFLNQFDNFEEKSNCTLPNGNIPEKIILIIDQAQNENFTSFKLQNSSITPLSMLKRAIHVFIKLKHMINKSHEFAVIILNTDTAGWYLNFSTEIRRISALIDKLGECEVKDTFDLNTIFDEILENITLPQVTENMLPPYLIRTVLFYGRPYTFPKWELTDEIKNLLEHPYFICDVVMTHEPVDKDNKCKKIFEILQNLDKKGYSYFFPVCRDARRLHTSIAKLLAHPLQRPSQKLQKK